jgi:phosphinothricin acetyltransferase
VKVELATRGDVEAILDISNAAAVESVANLATSPEPLDQWLAAFDRDHAAYPWLTATERGELLGFAKAGPHRTRDAYAWTAEVSVYVKPSSHRRGVARALYGKLLPLLRTQGFATLIAGISQPNEASVALHESLGFERCAVFTRAGYKWGAWRDVGYWQLHLRAGDAPPAPLQKVAECWPLRA